jgi:hypothetical protein
MGDIATKLVKDYEGMKLGELADAPVAALQGVSDGDAQKLMPHQDAADRRHRATPSPDRSPAVAAGRSPVRRGRAGHLVALPGPARRPGAARGAEES